MLICCGPDVVGSARRTLEVFEHWKPRLAGWHLALVCQNGQEHLPIPWDDISAVFIGGSTNWKLSDEAAQIVKAAKALGKWVHAGRVNHPERWQYLRIWGPILPMALVLRATATRAALSPVAVIKEGWG